MEKKTMIKEYHLNSMYLIYSDGRVYSKLSNKFIGTPLDRYGYKKVVLYVNNRKTHKTIHRLVAECFVPNPENKPQVNHLDGNKENNCFDNLEWVSQEENRKHSQENHLRKIYLKGDQVYNSKFTAEEIKFIRRIWYLKMTQSEIGDLLGVSHKLIHKIVNNKSYTNVK